MIEIHNKYSLTVALILHAKLLNVIKSESTPGFWEFC